MNEGFARFRHWFVNVYWYHYKWTTFIVIAVVLLIAVFASDMLSTVDFDYEMIITSQVMLVDEQMSEFTELMDGVVGDVNGDGKTYCYANLLNLTGGEMEQAALIKFNAMVIDQSVTLFILDEEMAENYRTEGLFEPLSTFGLQGTDGSEYFIEAQDLPIFQRAGLDRISRMQESKFYICFRVMAEGSEDDPEVMASYDRSVDIAKAVIDTP